MLRHSCCTWQFQLIPGRHAFFHAGSSYLNYLRMHTRLQTAACRTQLPHERKFTKTPTTLCGTQGETPAEIAGLARAMLHTAVAVPTSADVVDIVGTGGDGIGSVNISTGASIVAAAAGAKARARSFVGLYCSPIWPLHPCMADRLMPHCYSAMHASATRCCCPQSSATACLKSPSLCHEYERLAIAGRQARQP